MKFDPLDEIPPPDENEGEKEKNIDLDAPITDDAEEDVMTEKKAKVEIKPSSNIEAEIDSLRDKLLDPDGTLDGVEQKEMEHRLQELKTLKEQESGTKSVDIDEAANG